MQDTPGSGTQSQYGDNDSPGGSTTTTAAAATGSSNKRKRGTGSSSSSRGVANLTPEQLERKRANDREAQRAIRERTKNQIERLNERIRVLEGSQPYRELQAVIASRDDVVRENEAIKSHLASFVDIFQRFLGGVDTSGIGNGSSVPQGLEELAAAAERNVVVYTPSDQPHISSHQNHGQQPSGQRRTPDNSLPRALLAGAETTVSQLSLAMTRTFPCSAVQSNGPAARTTAWESSANGHYEHQSRSIHSDLAYTQSDERLGVDFLLENSGQPRPEKPFNRASPTASASSADGQGHFTVLPKHIPPETTLDKILLDAVAERRRKRYSGMPIEEVEGPPYPNWNALLQRDTSIPSHPLSKLFTDILRTFPDLATLPEQVAVLYIMYLHMRWEVHPSQKNYERLPDWIRPLPSQLFTPHAAWLDYIPWPRLRDNAVQADTTPNLDTFFVPYTTTLSLNWPYAPEDVLLPSHAAPPPCAQASSLLNAPGSPAAGGTAAKNSSPIAAAAAAAEAAEPLWRINPAFKTHLRDLSNWSLGPLFAETYPDWAELVRIKYSHPADAAMERRGR